MYFESETVTRRQRQRERNQSKGLMSVMAVHLRYISWCITFLSFTNQVLLTTGTTTANFSYSYLERNAFVAYLAWASFNTDKRTE